MAKECLFAMSATANIVSEICWRAKANKSEFDWIDDRLLLDCVPLTVLATVCGDGLNSVPKADGPVEHKSSQTVNATGNLMLPERNMLSQVDTVYVKL